MTSFANSRVAGRSPNDLNPVTCMLLAPQQPSLRGGLTATLPGDSGDYLSTPDSVAASITGDIDVRGRFLIESFATTQTLISKSNNGPSGRTFDFNILNSKFRLLWSEDGTAIINKASDTELTITGIPTWARFTMDVDDGAGGYVLKFYTSPEQVEDSDDVVVWTQSGATVTGASTTSFFDSAAQVEVGTNALGVGGPLTGEAFRAQIYNGIDGTLAVDMDPNKYISGTTFVPDTGEIWTIKGNVTIN